MNKFLLCNEKIPKGPGQEVERNRARPMSSLDPDGGVGEVQRGCLSLAAAAQAQGCLWARGLPGCAIPSHSAHLYPSSMNWLSRMWAGSGVYEQMWSWAAESISESIPVLFPSLLKCFPCVLSTLSCTLPLIFCFICGYQETSSVQLPFLYLKTISH